MAEPGYISDAEFRTSYIATQSPVSMAFAAALHGWVPPDPGTPFTYCDLACGTGITLNTLAAANPESRFWGVDFNAGHVEAARSLAAEAGLDNVTFVQGDLADLPPDAVPTCDFLTIHGAYSWLDPAPAAGVIALAGRILRPGGLFAVQVQTWSNSGATEAVWRTLRAVARGTDGPSTARAAAGLDRIVDLVRRKAPYFEQHPTAREYVESFDRERRLMPAQIERIAHVVLAEGAHPRTAAELAREMAPAGLRLIGTAVPRDADPAISLPAAFRDLFEGLDDAAAIETLRDFVVLRELPTYLFAREAGPDPAAATDFAARRLAFVPLGRARWIPRAVDVGRGEKTRLSQAVYDSLIDGLDAGPASLEGLRDRVDLGRHEAAELMRRLGRLAAAGGYAVAPVDRAAGKAPSSDDDDGRIAFPLAFNRVVVGRARDALMPVTPASVLTGDGQCPLDRLETAVLRELAEGEADADRAAASHLAASGLSFPKGKVVVRAADVTVEELHAAHQRLDERKIPILRRLGIVGATEGTA